ncbi:MAG: hypothetical protein IKG52_06755 [Rhodobacteraceae bacterium]|nr:hypothetical protein [Paracoccaceae bacterium]
MQMLQKAIIASTLLAVSACATAVTGRNDPPRVSFLSTSSLDDTLGCVVSHMTAVNPWNYPFRALIVQLGEAYEVHPTREIMLGGEPIFVTVMRVDNGTAVEGYSLSRFQGIFDQLEITCR